MSSSHDSTLPGLHLANTGSYPRIGDGPELQILRRATTSLDRGDRNTADLLDAENDMIRRAIADQLKAGLEVITDGQIRWYDPRRALEDHPHGQESTQRRGGIG